MIIERDIQTIEKGLNEILSRIEYLKDINYDDINMSSVGAVEGHLENLKEIQVLEDVLRMFHINSYEYDEKNTKISILEKHVDTDK